MRTLKREEGSVLMEFVIVLPIYMLLIGFAFVIGEMGLQGIHLAASADRTHAVAGETAFQEFAKAASPDKGMVEPDFSYAADGGGSEKVSRYEKRHIELVAEASGGFSGPWTKAVAAFVKDEYTLTPYSRGFIAYWFRERYNLNDELQSVDDGSGGETALDRIVGHGVGRADMVGKDETGDGAVRKYGYYSLMRNDKERNDGELPYRKWGAGALSYGDNWHDKVYKEAVASVAHEYVDVQSGSDTGGAMPANPGSPGAYDRDMRLRMWSE